MATPRRDSEAARILADIHRLAQERVSLSASLYALQQWQNVNPLKPVLGPWVLRVLARVLRNRRESRLLARRYYNLSRALAGGRALSNPQGAAYPPLVPLTRLLDDFGDVVDDITRGTAGRTRESRSDRRNRVDPSIPSTAPPREETLRERVDEVTDELDKALDAFEKKFKDILNVSVEVDEFKWPDPGEDRGFEKDLQKEVQDILKTLEREVKQLERDPEIEVVEFRQRTQDRSQAGGYKASGKAGDFVTDANNEALNEAMGGDDLILGWIRVTSGNPCSFCAMLASRGTQRLYRSEASALLTPRLGSANENRRARKAAESGADIAFVKAHDNCRCSAMPVFNTSPFRSKRDKYFEDNWGKATKGQSGRDALNAWRRWLSKQYAAGLVPDDEITKT